MPFLKFRCTKCGNVFDELTAIDKINELKCPKCGSKVQRAYEGKCVKSGSGCSGSCASCGGCTSH